MTFLSVALEAAAEHDPMLAFYVGGGTLALLFGMMFALIAFGGGRDHS